MLMHRRLRTFRTLFVHRWHAAQTIGEWFGNDDIGFRFEHINHTRSLVEYIWRYGAFSESSDGTGRVPHPTARSLRSIVRPVARKGRKHFEKAVKYAVLFGTPPPARVTRRANQPEQEARNQMRLLIEIRRRTKEAWETEPGRALHRYASEHPDIKEFASRLIELHLAMLPYYVQMRYLTAQEADEYPSRKIPLLVPLGGSDGSKWTRPDNIDPTTELRGDLVAALRGVFAANIHNALACRARADLFETATNLPEGKAIAVEEDRVPAWDARGTATALVNGRRRRFAVLDPALAAMLDSIAEKPMPALIRWLAAFRVAVSTMITAMPVFIVKNFFRDTLAGFVAGRYVQVPILGTLLGGLHAAHDLVTGRSRRMGDYLLQGGFYSGLVESEVDLTGTRLGRPGAMAGSVGRWWSRLVYVVTRPAWIAEAGTRVDQFQSARRQRAGGYDAIRAARMVSADFANIGASREWRMYVATVPFLNAAIQGLDQLYQIVRFRSRRDRSSPIWGSGRLAHVAKTLFCGLILSSMTWVGWEHNHRGSVRRAAYENQTDYEKASWVTLHGVAPGTDIRIPVPFQIGAVFVKLPEVVLDLTQGSDTQAGPKFVWSLIHGNLAVGWIPAVAQPFVEVYTNRNFFGEEIIPAYMKSWPPEAQYFHRSTPLPYRTAGEIVGASPLHIQTFVRAWTGHFGNAVVAVLDEEVFWDRRAHGARPFPKAKQLLTGVYSLRTPRPRTYTRTSNEFYSLAAWLEGRMVIARRDRRITQPIGRGYGISQARLQQASGLRRLADQVRLDPMLTARQKERQIEEVYADIDAAFTDALPAMRIARNEGG